MNNYLIEKDLVHLERVVNKIAASHGLSLSYWRKRVDSMLSLTLMPAQRKRVGQIHAAISMLEDSNPGPASTCG
ncbi:hypothetical protein [Caballeronia sordidicola]|uniref:Uncharacterized protein n=1 Tax=Caballeronia sordidicola TaxID=196367 RepID=A0A242MGQ7_CABSO|nr:hypothetical protein [Caballeronia sordidicola]OTP69920.1 hypothetical protein PAMC26577_29790 [Caballeronia sordidicola]